VQYGGNPAMALAVVLLGGLLQILFVSALPPAVLGSLDSLLISLIAGDITRTRRKSDRELIGQGIDIVDWDHLTHIRRGPRVEVFFMLVVMGLTVFVDLIVAVGVGVVMASLLFVKSMADLQNRSVRAEALRHALEHIDSPDGAAPERAGEEPPNIKTGRDSGAPAH